jgi:hypothetical protein
MPGRITPARFTHRTIAAGMLVSWDKQSVE